MKKILVFFIVFGIVGTSLPARAEAAAGRQAGKHKFLVTAYYSPLPDQSFYIRGSFEADRRLNGNGTNGADGIEVFTGMLAAPSVYAFGTRILIPGLGVGQVHDRGGAIIAKADYDRIDVWMGRGEDGLARAINWGARLVDGEIYDSAAEMKVNLDFASVSTHLGDALIARLQNQTALSQSVAFSKPVEQATPEEIKDLQVSLTLFGNYNGPIDGALSAATRDAILRFQTDEGLVNDKNSSGAGMFGPITRAKLQEKVAGYDAEREKEATLIEANRANLSAGLGKNAQGNPVEALQTLLWTLGYYTGAISSHYDTPTIDAVFSFQQTQGLVSTPYDEGAGYYGKKTHEALIAALDERLTVMKEYPKEMQSWIPAEIPLPKLADLTPAPEMFAPVTLHFDVAFIGDGQETPYQFTRDLSLGDHGEAVQKLQEILIGQEYLSAGLDTGSFGNQTQAALQQFQREHGLPALGRVGPQTREALNAL